MRGGGGQSGDGENDTNEILGQTTISQENFIITYGC